MFKTSEQFQAEDRRKMRDPTEKQLHISKVLEGIANKKETVITSVALAYVLHKAPYVFPICGGRSVKHLEDNIKALGLALTREEIVEIDDSVPFDRGFPYTMLAPDVTHDEIEGPQDVAMSRQYAVVDQVKPEQPIPAGQHHSKAPKINATGE